MAPIDLLISYPSPVGIEVLIRHKYFACSHNPFRLIGVGLSVWTFAVAGCASSFDFWSIAICRM